MERVKAGALPRDGVASLREPQLQIILDREFGKAFTVNGIYTLLNRHDLACLEPRPRHPRQDPAAAKKLGSRERAVMVLDRAGWHTAKQLEWPKRITPLFLPPYSPELNPAERLWLWFREHDWSNGAYPDEAVRKSWTTA